MLLWINAKEWSFRQTLIVGGWITKIETINLDILGVRQRSHNLIVRYNHDCRTTRIPAQPAIPIRS